MSVGCEFLFRLLLLLGRVSVCAVETLFVFLLLFIIIFCCFFICVFYHYFFVRIFCVVPPSWPHLRVCRGDFFAVYYYHLIFLCVFIIIFSFRVFVWLHSWRRLRVCRGDFSDFLLLYFYYYSFSEFLFGLLLGRVSVCAVETGRITSPCPRRAKNKTPPTT